jgi:hypothetical protein
MNTFGNEKLVHTTELELVAFILLICCKYGINKSIRSTRADHSDLAVVDIKCLSDPNIDII